GETAEGWSARAEAMPPAAAWQEAQAGPSARDGGDSRRPPRMSPEEARRTELDRLFAALRDAPDEAGAALVEARIWALWTQAASPSVQLLMRRGLRNMEARVPEEALEDFDAAITLAPDFAEAWHRRAQ